MKRITDYQISSSSDIQLLFPRSISNLLFPFLHLSFRSQVLHSCCGKKASGAHEDVTLQRAGEGGCNLSISAVVGRVPGTVIWCTKRNKNHIARDFHSFTAQLVTHRTVSIAGCFCVAVLAALIGFSWFLMLDVAMESNMGEVRYGDQLSADFSQGELWHSTESVETLTRLPLNVQLSEIQTLHTSRLSNTTGSWCKCTWGPCSFTW